MSDKKRKLMGAELMIVSRMLDKMSFKSYAEYLVSNKVDKLLKMGEKKEQKIVLMMADICFFILQNIHKAEDETWELISSYSGKKVCDVKFLDVDEITEYIKDIFMAGIPKVISKLVDMDQFKKKFEEMPDKAG